MACRTRIPWNTLGKHFSTTLIFLCFGVITQHMKINLSGLVHKFKVIVGIWFCSSSSCALWKRDPFWGWAEGICPPSTFEACLVVTYLAYLSVQVLILVYDQSLLNHGPPLLELGAGGKVEGGTGAKLPGFICSAAWYPLFACLSFPICTMGWQVSILKTVRIKWAN